MATRNDFDDFFGDEEAPVADTRADGRLYRVPLTRVSPNLVNPRTDFGTDDQLIDLGKSLARRQNQPCPVVSRNAYLKLWPEHGDRIKDVDYILVSGERRYRGASIVGLPALNCVANDDFATDRKTFMEAVVSENVDRQNFDPVEEAYAVQALVAEFGSNRAVAQHFERVDGWVTQRLLLTHLARETQDLVRQKTMPLEVARQLGKLARDNGWSSRDQLEWWESEQDRRSAVSAARSAARKAARQDPPEHPVPVEPSFTAVKPEPAPPSAQGARFTAVNQDADAAAGAPPAARPVQPQAVNGTQGTGLEDIVPEPREAEPAAAELGGDRKPVMFPYDDGAFAAQLLIERMPAEEFDKMAGRVLAHHAQRRAGTG
ncbi:hypothetical protein [Streptomyces chartreusis]|uniref:ParB/RepB/Spo0J family partition protein n=1 Tax=Streptomyces chartreusis TaxID=1969 RepID=UPI0037DCC0C4|nr:hypothetical protein OG938_47870 [Streptomyces chartreusis]